MSRFGFLRLVIRYVLIFFFRRVGVFFVFEFGCYLMGGFFREFGMVFRDLFVFILSFF